MAAKSFSFRKEWLDALQGYPQEFRQEVTSAILEYALYGKMPENEKVLYSPFPLIKAQIDAAAERRENRKKGGAPIGNQNAKKTTKNNLKQPKKIREKETEKKKEKESIPPQTPSYKEKEINKEKEKEREPLSISQKREEDFFNDYFSPEREFLRDQFVYSLRASNKDADHTALYEMASETLGEFLRQGKYHYAYHDFANHLENVVRIKNGARGRAANQANNDNGLQQYLKEQQRLLETQLAGDNSQVFATEGRSAC